MKPDLMLGQKSLNISHTDCQSTSREACSVARRLERILAQWDSDWSVITGHLYNWHWGFLVRMIHFWIKHVINYAKSVKF